MHNFAKNTGARGRASGGISIRINKKINYREERIDEWFTAIKIYNKKINIKFIIIFGYAEYEKIESLEKTGAYIEENIEENILIMADMNARTKRERGTDFLEI